MSTYLCDCAKEISGQRLKELAKSAKTARDFNLIDHRHPGHNYDKKRAYLDYFIRETERELCPDVAQELKQFKESLTTSPDNIFQRMQSLDSIFTKLQECFSYAARTATQAVCGAVTCCPAVGEACNVYRG